MGEGGSVIDTDFAFEAHAHFQKNHDTDSLMRVVVTLVGRHSSMQMTVSRPRGQKRKRAGQEEGQEGRR